MTSDLASSADLGNFLDGSFLLQNCLFFLVRDWECHLPTPPLTAQGAVCLLNECLFWDWCHIWAVSSSLIIWEPQLFHTSGEPWCDFMFTFMHVFLKGEFWVCTCSFLIECQGFSGGMWLVLPLGGTWKLWRGTPGCIRNHGSAQPQSLWTTAAATVQGLKLCQKILTHPPRLSLSCVCTSGSLGVGSRLGPGRFWVPS